ncbi:helix-turn-helix domain-containing protein [Dyadobacter chenwenxiniae]|uniref:Helix-turn-helix domain-containing protein n=1 Tax=Dyadobacter chenwenxiniae TaxID=2906456 RepID=A0A9X1PR31_9BACT|nr:helix-turn-helix domain-containing protein [Dyadobacter chenwenxiniae]MCF0065867.1 helix-turn-helix domain-containing protein [Dyadobacter chenwenxiniae]UON82260.1 helix-turn-helix domain-containing protein [Dyadobacter chenwenxiniae]UON82920.1 helix-turn-helix domain-containing protein [Dyadobacter chenwenxiniae]UON83200.1 helix-turn-helix domain-containing protein [Dyadobacter chenwenxiniae]UON84110.1 helix-turn-helix domain-containing protein [Dyadobacter chenwenxiniae]
MGKNRKHSVAFRLKVVKAYLAGDGINELSRRFKIAKSSVQKWIGHYKQGGGSSLLPQYGHNYTKEFKQQVVHAYQNQGLSLNECCFKFKIPSMSTLHVWIRQYEQFGIDGFITARGRPRSMKNKPKIIKTYGPLTRLEELENENLRLRAENDLLKKLDALIREKEAAQKKKR